MGRKETAPFDNPWLSAIDSTENKITRFAQFDPLYSASERPCSVWIDPRPLAPAEKDSASANDCHAASSLLFAAEQQEADAPLLEEIQQLLPTLARISQRLQMNPYQMGQRGARDESVEVALRVVRKQRAGRLK